MAKECDFMRPHSTTAHLLANAWVVDAPAHRAQSIGVNPHEGGAVPTPHDAVLERVRKRRIVHAPLQISRGSLAAAQRPGEGFAHCTSKRGGVGDQHR